MGRDFCVFCLLTFGGSFAGTRAEFCQDGNFTKFYTEFLCILTIDIFPIIVYNKDTKEREVNLMTVIITCELTEDIEKLNASKLNELSELLQEFFNGTCECFDVERKRGNQNA